MKKIIYYALFTTLLIVFFSSQGCSMTESDEITETISHEIFVYEETLHETITYKESSTSVTAKNNKEETQETNKIIPDADPLKGEYFVYAILKSIDTENNVIIVKQLVNEPNEKIIEPQVKLSSNCRIIKVILEMPDEKENISEIKLSDIPESSEIGIIFKSDNTARAVIYQELVEND